MKFIHAIFVSSLFFLVITAANADESFRCGSYLVEIGDNQENVLEHCGQPTAEKGWTWTYDRGPEKFNVLVHFGANGSVNKIEEGDTL
jgi:hypothetical protein